MSTTRSATINSSWDGELLGLNASSNGRSCEQHECCGKAVKPDDVIRFKLAVVEAVLGKPLEMIKAVIIKDSTELCTDPLHHSKRGMYHHQKWSKSDFQGHTAQLYQHPLQSWDQWPQWPSPPYLWVSLAPSAELSRSWWPFAIFTWWFRTHSDRWMYLERHETTPWKPPEGCSSLNLDLLFRNEKSIKLSYY